MTEILEKFPRMICFPKLRINENGGKMIDVKLLLPNRIAAIATSPGSRAGKRNTDS